MKFSSLRPDNVIAQKFVDYCDWDENNLEKYIEPDLEKGGGEGSRGGKVIGHTKSGHPIYESHGGKAHEAYPHFSAEDHTEAARHHKAAGNSSAWAQHLLSVRAIKSGKHTPTEAPKKETDPDDAAAAKAGMKTEEYKKLHPGTKKELAGAADKEVTSSIGKTKGGVEVKPGHEWSNGKTKFKIHSSEKAFDGVGGSKQVHTVAKYNSKGEQAGYTVYDTDKLLAKIHNDTTSADTELTKKEEADKPAEKKEPSSHVSKITEAAKKALTPEYYAKWDTADLREAISSTETYLKDYKETHGETTTYKRREGELKAMKEHMETVRGKGEGADHATTAKQHEKAGLDRTKSMGERIKSMAKAREFYTKHAESLTDEQLAYHADKAYIGSVSKDIYKKHLDNRTKGKK